MQSIKLNTYVGDDGMLKLQIPVGVSNAEMEVVVIYQPITADPIKPVARSVMPVEEVESGWADEPVGRAKSGSSEIREEMW
ncbi:hypothetical protein ACN4EK_28510 [Pantanalinema rosaneae CENA516]|uniref:hypothetical protein n=1 Tax=Pantanalinema rosaneae TaxID=1620701 RepID=UPI003D6E46A1